MNSVSTLRIIARETGLFVGPIAGGLITKYAGFPHLTEIYALLFLAFGCIEMSMVLNEYKGRSSQQSLLSSQEEEERKLLAASED